MSLKDISDWCSLLDPSCQIPTDVMFVVTEELMKNGRTVQVMNNDNVLIFGFRTFAPPGHER